MKKIIFITLLFVTVFSCKKKEDPDPDPSGTPITNVTPSDSSYYNALFSCMDTYAKLSGTFTPLGKLANAYYSSQYVTNEVYHAADLQDMGIVSLNNVIFKNKSAITNFYYNDTTGTQFAAPYTWSVSGAGSIATFSYSNPNTPPTFTASANIPDSISTAAGFTVNIKGTGDCSLIRVFILGGTGSTTFPNKLIAGTDTSIRFSATDLQGINPTNAGYISVQFFRDNYRSIAGKRVNFRTGLNYYNSAFKIKP